MTFVRVRRALLRAGVSATAIVLAGVGLLSPEGARAAAAAAGPKLYILDCGTIAPMDPNLFGLKKEEIKGDASFVSPCYLVVHAKGTLIWDVGQVPTLLFRTTERKSRSRAS